MSRRTVTYENFSGGEYGRRGGVRPPPNSFTATNMLRYATGELGVRPALTAVAVTGTSNGIVHGFGNSPVPGADGWYVQGTAVYTFDWGGSAVSALTGTLDATPTEPLDWCAVGTKIYVTSWGDKGYIFDLHPSVRTVADLGAGATVSPGGRCIGTYGARMVIGNVGVGTEYRLRFSDVADYTSWPTGNFVDIGDAWGITGLYPQRQHLLALKQVGLHTVTGVLGDGQTVRKAHSAGGPLSALEGTLSENDLMFYFPTGSSAPAVFNGASNSKLNHLGGLLSSTQGTALPANRGVATLNGDVEGAVFVQKTNAGALAFVNDTWTKHTFDVAVSGYINKSLPNGSHVRLCDGGAAGTPPKFYSWDLSSTTPGAQDGAATAGSLAGAVTFPESWAAAGEEEYVRSVTVDFRRANVGTNNTFTLTVSNLPQYSGGAATTSAQSYSAAAADVPFDRAIFGFGDQGMGGGFSLAFTGIKGIAIQSIEVVLETLPARI